ncbi:MAG: hypothetical protein COS71_03245 [Candidatus Moranbacteria bacterium CG06_land_8_20_14_3_00_40_12]|nr:MAG: hypothetical protein COX31_03770 [Candidatus Moranbacteria bacterium CG23_combo_of_CG06-09_8_20_14_all_40_16]PIU80476.1 MAG: hypothetical protein COS71_03245 [Candidatus Moranbacteria bacterium CG06_land_8_20_14_3_00_40_12]
MPKEKLQNLPAGRQGTPSPTPDLDPLRHSFSEASEFQPYSLKLLIFAPQKKTAELFYAHFV